MTQPGFLNPVPLPDFDGLTLAATGARALERFSDLVTGTGKLADMKASDRFDIMDECLDVVLVRADLPAGFEFTGISVAEFRVALRKANQPRPIIDAWRGTLLGEGMESLREAARQRIACRPAYTFLNQCRLWLPAAYEDTPRVILPDCLAQLMSVVDPQWIVPQRSRYTVELLEIAGAPGRKLPTRGKRFPAPIRREMGLWYCWDEQRLQPRGVVGDGYFELQLALPSLEESYFSNHFMARNVFAHFRCTCFDDSYGQNVMLIDEVQSDWMRDLRWQRQGRPLPKRWMIDRVREQDSLPPPPCPVEKDWLEITLDACIYFAERCGCDVIAWTPGAIQNELNPCFPLETAQKLYDQDLPESLKALLLNKRNCHAETYELEYPTYQRNVLFQRRKKGWGLVNPDGKTPASDLVRGREAIYALFREWAIPTVERLPGLWLFPNSNEIDGLFLPATLMDKNDGGHGNQWGVFDEDVFSFSARCLPVALREGREFAPLSADKLGPLAELIEPRALGLLYAERPEDLDRAGMLSLAAMNVVGEDGQPCNEFRSAYPFFADGIRYPVEVSHIHLHPNRLEAVLELSLARTGLPVSVFDALFYKRYAYLPGEAVLFSLAALAYSMEPVEKREFVIDEPEQIRNFHARDAWVKEHGQWIKEQDEAAALAAWEPQTTEDREPIRISMSRMCMFMPDFDGVGDEAGFRGEVMRVAPDVHILFGVKFWRVEVIVVRDVDQDFLLPFFVADHLFQDGWRPSVGDYVEGEAWIQGYLVVDKPDSEKTSPC